MKTETFQRITFFLLLGVVSLLFLWMIRDFLLTLFMAAIFAGLAAPLYQWFVGKMGGRKAWASSLTLLTLFFIFGIPLFLFIGILTNEAIKVSTNAGPWIQERMQQPGLIGDYLARLPGYHYIEPYKNEILNRAGALTSNLGRGIFSHLSAFTTGTFSFLLHLALMIYSMFFFFIKGEEWLKRLFHLMPLEHKHEMKMLKGFQSMTKAVVKGTLVVGIVQGGLAGLALGVAGVPSSVFWGTVMVFASLLPTVGTALVWLPASIILMIQGEVMKGILVFLWCALVVGTVDNIIRPILVGKDTKMHELMVLISTLGGLILFGLPGFIIGPVIASLFVTVWDIYGELFKDALPEVKSLS